MLPAVWRAHKYSQGLYHLGCVGELSTPSAVQKRACPAVWQCSLPSVPALSLPPLMGPSLCICYHPQCLQLLCAVDIPSPIFQIRRLSLRHIKCLIPKLPGDEAKWHRDASILHTEHHVGVGGQDRSLAACADSPNCLLSILPPSPLLTWLLLCPGPQSCQP